MGININMNISGDCHKLAPQPILPSVVRNEEQEMKQELESNKARLIETKRQMIAMRDQIKKLASVLQREVGEEADIKEMLKLGHSPGWQTRAQLVMNLRLKLIAMRSKFLDPPHKMYYRGPFDPGKEFDLKFLPQKQENLYRTMMEQKKIFHQGKPIEILKKECDDLSLMYRAARFRTKSLQSKVNDASKQLEKAKEKAEVDLRVIGAMMAHQSLLKMMIEPESFRLDPELQRHIKVNPLEPAKVADWAKFKMLLDRKEKQKHMFRTATFMLTEKLDKVKKNLIEAKNIDLENRLSMEAQTVEPEKPSSGKDKSKGKDKSEKEAEEKKKLDLLTEENRHLREFLLSPVLSEEEDFRVFVSNVEAIKRQFINVLENLAINVTSNE